jgi:hypothetical protein
VFFTIQDGQPVVAELRVHTHGDPLPRGGLTTRVLRRIRVGRWMELAHDGLARERDMFDRRIAAPWNALARARPRRRSGRADGFYAELAREYVALAPADRHPVVTLATVWRAQRTHVRDWLRA